MRECLSNAMAAWAAEDYGTALKEYLKNLCMCSEQERMDKFQEQFAKLIAEASAAGVIFNDKNKMLQDNLFAKSPLVLWSMGNMVMASDPFEALSLYSKAAAMSGGLDLINTIGSILACRSTIVSTWHISMVNDQQRNTQFCTALSRIVMPDSKVLDIGAGTGLLSMYATRFTYHPVIGLEGERPMAQLGQACVSRNRLDHRVQILPVMSSAYTPLPAQIPTVIVSETMDAGGLGEKILQIFHDAHTRFKGGDPAHRITFCPSKLTFYVVLIESESFWRSRMHAHACREFGCDASCVFGAHANTLLSDHDMHRSIETSYTAIDADDFEDLVFISERQEIFATPLDSDKFLSDLSIMKTAMETFAVPITRAGRADAALLCWKATLAEGVELESVREGGWDYAAYPFQARTAYQPGDTFHGEYVVNFEQGIAINHIHDPATTQGRVGVQGAYDEFLYKKDDGTIEMVNNLSLRRFLSATPSRLPLWLLNGMDPYFPVTNEGTLQFQYLENAEEARGRQENREYDTITSVKAYGCLFHADYVNVSARPKRTTTLGVDVRILDDFVLAEYREIRGAFREGGRVTMLSEPVLLIDLDPMREYEPIVAGEQCEAMPTQTGFSDGIIYWWVLRNEQGEEWSTREAGLPLAACLFNKREVVMEGKKMFFNMFMKDSEFIMSYGNGRIFASPEDAALAAPAPPPSPDRPQPMQLDEQPEPGQLGLFGLPIRPAPPPPRTTDV